MIGLYLPRAADLPAAAALLAVALLLCGMGRLLAGRAGPPETALMAGWGALCLLLTGWAVLSPVSLTLPLALFACVAVFGLHRPPPVTPAILLIIPLLLVLLPARPSQIDTWLNLLPNLAYLADHAALPHDGGPPSWSFLPAAPYNTQFVGFALSQLAGALMPNALSLFNALLLCAAALHLGRVAGGDGASGQWWKLAMGLLLALPLNPGFTPRIFLASYGEAPIAVTVMFAVALGADLFAAMRASAPWRHIATALAFVLAALVEIKQSALGLVIPFAATLLTLGLVMPGMPRVRWASAIAAATAPALGLYLLWRWYVLGHFAVGELKMLPLAEWHLALLPRIFGGIAFAIFQKATYFIAVIALLGAALLEARRRPWQRAAIILALGAGLVAGFNAFLLFTYVAHFPAIWAVNAHSYFRYMSQLSLAVMLGLATWLRPAATAWLAGRTPVWRHRLAVSAVALAIAFPLLGARLLRFDLDDPQPFLWDIARRAAPLLREQDRVALLLPGDGDDAVGSLLRGVLLFTPPRHPHLGFRTELSATPSALADAQAAGFTRAIVSCAPAGLAGVPPGAAGLLALDGSTWHAVAVWRTPRMGRFSAMLPRGAICESSQQAVPF